MKKEIPNPKNYDFGDKIIPLKFFTLEYIPYSGYGQQEPYFIDNSEEKAYWVAGIKRIQARKTIFTETEHGTERKSVSIKVYTVIILREHISAKERYCLYDDVKKRIVNKGIVIQEPLKKTIVQQTPSGGLLFTSLVRRQKET